MQVAMWFDVHCEDVDRWEAEEREERIRLRYQIIWSSLIQFLVSRSVFSFAFSTSTIPATLPVPYRTVHTNTTNRILIFWFYGYWQSEDKKPIIVPVPRIQCSTTRGAAAAAVVLQHPHAPNRST